MNSQLKSLFLRLKDRKRYQNFVIWIIRCLGPDSMELSTFLCTIEKCLDAEIDPECLMEAGYILGRSSEYETLLKAQQEYEAKVSDIQIAQPSTFQRSENKSSVWAQQNAETLFPIILDEKLEFSLIYQNNLFCKISIQDSLRDYFFREHGRFPSADEFSRLRMRYYYFCNRMYTEKTLNNIQDELKIDATQTDTILSPNVNIAQTTPKHHIFYLWHNGNCATMVYKKTEQKYLLLSGSAISKNFTESANREKKIVDKWMRENILTSMGNNVWRLSKTQAIHSPSQAASIVKGTRITGTKIWINHYNESIKENIRKERKRPCKVKKRGPGRPRKSS